MRTDLGTGISVIVRADRDEPVKLRAIGTSRQDVVVVAGEDDTKAIGFPAGLVFELDEALFKRLRIAFGRHDAAALARAWQLARRFDPGKLGHAA